MKKKLIFLFSVFVFVVGVVSVHSFGDSSDPLISKSYFDKKIAELKGELNKNDGVSSEKKEESVKYIPVNLKKDEEVFFDEGTEFILRSGTATVIDATGNGLPDLTDGSNLKNGMNLPKNHSVLCPRNDGRGIHCGSEIWLMIKGSYAVKKVNDESSDTKDSTNGQVDEDKSKDNNADKNQEEIKNDDL